MRARLLALEAEPWCLAAGLSFTQARQIDIVYLYCQYNLVLNIGCTKDNLTPFSLQPWLDVAELGSTVVLTVDSGVPGAEASAVRRGAQFLPPV